MTDARTLSKIRQYFGPSPRHPEACIELSFGVDGRKFWLGKILQALQGAGLALPVPLADKALPLPEAVGTLACAVLSKSAPPTWSCGSEGDIGWVCLSHPQPKIAGLALRECQKAILACHEPGTDVPGEFLALVTRAPSINNIRSAVVQAASMLGLDSVTVSHFANVYQVGQASRAVHFFELANQKDSLTGFVLSRDKRATNELLRNLGLPTTRAVSVGSRDGVAAAVRQVGFPCVVKPCGRGKGKGVTTSIRHEGQVAFAVEHALRFGDFPILIENHVEGFDHRLLVVEGELLWIYRREPPLVVGNGQATIRDLVEHENRRRRDLRVSEKSYLRDIVIDPELERFVKEHSAMDLNSIPGKGHGVALAGPANVARGGTMRDVTSDVHPDNRQLALEVAEHFRTSALGIDLVTTDIGRSWREVPSAIVEVNCTPGISGKGDAGLALRTIFPDRCSGKVPCFIVAGDDVFKEAISKTLAQELENQNLVVGCVEYMTDKEVSRAGSDIAPSIYSRGVERMLIDRQVEAIVVSCAQDRLKQFGFPLQHCDVLFASDPISSADIENMARRIVVGKTDSIDVACIALEAIEPYRDGMLGGRRPTLEQLSGQNGESDDILKVRVRCWRVRALPRAWFWRQVPGKQAMTTGMISYADLFAAVVSFADARLEQLKEQPLGADFSLPAKCEPWDTPYVDAEIPVRNRRRNVLKDALLDAIVAVNRIIDG